jgi:endonuclease G
MRWALPLLAATAVAHAGTAPVVGGSTVPDGKWPDTVAIIGTTGTCSGTLIAPTVVLTAGHCAEIDPKQIIANTTDFARQGGTHVNVRSITAYPDWKTSYDVSVIVLDSPVAGITPRAVGTSCSFGSFGTSSEVHLVGFGLTDQQGIGTNTGLHEAMAQVRDPDCSAGHGCKPAVAPGGEFVAGGGGTDSCFGDSGGPVYLDTPRGTIAIGAVSRGVDGSSDPCGGGGIYVRTDKLVAWIEETAGTAIAKDTCDREVEVPGVADDETAGCATSRPAAGLVPLVLALAFVRRRRR